MLKFLSKLANNDFIFSQIYIKLNFLAKNNNYYQPKLRLFYTFG